jgi:hypothetical protein
MSDKLTADQINDLLSLAPHIADRVEALGAETSADDIRTIARIALDALAEVERLQVEVEAAKLFGVGFYQATEGVQDVYRGMARAALERKP